MAVSRSGLVLAVVTGALLAGSYPALAQAGFCLYGCARDSDYILDHRVEDRSHDHTSDRYFLRIKPQKVAVQEIQIITDDKFNGYFNTKAVEVNTRRNGAKFAIDKVDWDDEQRALTISLAKPIPADEEIEIVLSQVVNPTVGGIYKMNARVLGTEPNPIFRYVGTWAISIE